MPADPHPFRPAQLLEHGAYLGALARELVGDAHAAADLVQDAYVAALEQPPRRAGALRAWLAVVTRNLARNRGRGEGRRAAREAQAARPERIEPEERALERLELRQELLALVLALPREQRTVLELRYFEGQSPGAIARTLGLPVKTVKSRHTRALAALRARLDERSQGDRSRWVTALLPLAAQGGAAGSALLGVLGGLAMKKGIVIAGVALLFVLAWQGFLRSGLGERYAASRARVPVDTTPLATQPPALAPALAPEELAGRAALSVTRPAGRGALQLRLRWPDGTPAADVPFALECEADPAPRVEGVRARTDADGQALLGDLYAGAVRLSLAAESFEAEVEADATRVLTLTLGEGFTVLGTVVDDAGAPVPGAEIWGGRSRFSAPGGERRTLTAGDGSFRLRGVDAFTPLGARKRGYLASVCQQPMDMEGTSAGARSVRLVLTQGGGRVQGRVLDPEGRPLPGALVLAGPAGGWSIGAGPGETPEPSFAETDAEGRFELLDHLPGGSQPVHASARGFPVWRGAVEVVEGGLAALEIRLEQPARIEGRLLDGAGAPVAGMKVRAAEEDRGGWYWDLLAPSEAVSDGQGWFVLEWVAPGLRELNAHDYRRPALGRARASVACSPGATATCELRLELGHTISGTVVDREGVPLVGWNVYSQPPFMQQWYPRSAKTDAQGRFLLANLGDSRHDLTVRAELGEHPRLRREGVAVGTRDLVLVVEDAHVQRGRLRGRLVTPGTSPAGFTLTLWKQGANEGHFLAQDEGGEFLAEAVPGSYSVRVAAGGRDVLSSPSFELAPGGFHDLGDLRLEGGGDVELELVGLPLSHLEGLSLSLEREGANSLDLTWSDGRLRASAVMPGRWRVTLHENELALRAPELEVLAGTTTRATLEVTRATMVTLVFANPEREEVTVETFDADGTRRQRRRYLADQDPTRLTLGLPPGPARITVRSHSGRTAEVELTVGEVEPAEPLELTLR